MTTKTHKRLPGKRKAADIVQDEPGAEERFKGILKRALNTPPPRKQKPAKRKPRS